MANIMSNYVIDINQLMLNWYLLYIDVTDCFHIPECGIYHKNNSFPCIIYFISLSLYKVPMIKVAWGVPKLCYPSLQNTLGNNYAKSHANMLMFDVQNACLKQTYFGKIRYLEKGQNLSCLCASLWELV